MKRRVRLSIVGLLFALLVSAVGLASAENPSFVSVGSRAIYHSRTTAEHPAGVGESIDTYTITAVSETEITVLLEEKTQRGVATATYRVDPRTRIVTNASGQGDVGMAFWLWIPTDASPGGTIELFDLTCDVLASTLRLNRTVLPVRCAENAQAYFAADDRSLLELDFPVVKWVRTTETVAAALLPSGGLVLPIGGLAIGGLVLGCVVWWAGSRRRVSGVERPVPNAPPLPRGPPAFLTVPSRGAPLLDEARQVPEFAPTSSAREVSSAEASVERASRVVERAPRPAMAPAPLRMLATNAPVDWPRVEYPDEAFWAPPDRGDAIVAGRVAAALERHFSSAGTRAAAVRRGSAWPTDEGMLHVPIEVLSLDGRTIAVAAYARSNPREARHFEKLRSACKHRDVPPPVYYAPKPLPDSATPE